MSTVDEDEERHGYDWWDDLDEDDREQHRLESLMAECGWAEDDGPPSCLMAGTEFHDFECPLRRSFRRACTHWRAQQRRRHGRGVGPDPRRRGVGSEGWRVSWACRRRKARRRGEA